MAGLPKSYIKKYGITKKAWREYRKANKPRSTTKKLTRKVKKVAKRKRSYSRKRKRRTKDKRVPLLTTIPVVYNALVEPLVGNEGMGYSGAIRAYQNTNDVFKAGKEYIKLLLGNFTGFDIDTGQWGGIFGWKSMLKTYGSMLAGYAGSKVATKLGANRALKNVPIIGKYIKL